MVSKIQKVLFLPVNVSAAQNLHSAYHVDKISNDHQCTIYGWTEVHNHIGLILMGGKRWCVVDLHFL